MDRINSPGEYNSGNSVCCAASNILSLVRDDRQCLMSHLLASLESTYIRSDNCFIILHARAFHSQENPPYNKGAFKIEITFPAEYPFKPPKICFKTRIYHPNIDEKGQVCLPIISAENWKPATKTDQGRNKVNDLRNSVR